MVDEREGAGVVSGPVGGDGLSATLSRRFEQQVRAWRDELVNLNRRNRSLYFKHTRSASFEIVAPDLVAIADRLDGTRASNRWEFYFPPPLPLDPDEPRALAPARGPNELQSSKDDPLEIERGLRALERKAKQEFVDKGLWVLYLGLGFMDWVDPDDGKPVSSPLLLLPVTFDRPSVKAPFWLARTDDDPVINPALAVKLAIDLDLEIPPIEDFDDPDPAAVLDRFRGITERREGWGVSERAVLTTFTFQKEAMYRDLLDNEPLIVEHAIAQVLGLGPAAPAGGELAFEPVGPGDLDEVVVPEDLVSIRDADSSQRQCILAARSGRSFVMDGPPGTGKSQTISNCIAELLHQGKSVLFVSEKAAALEVVYKRLQDAQLDDFVLELHSHKATRKAVAQELGTALSSRPQARSAFSEGQRGRLARERRALTAYVEALNEVRMPLGVSLHAALGEVVALQAQPEAPIPSAVDTDLSAAQLEEIQDAAQRLGRSWGPVARGTDFLWRDLTDDRMSAALKHGLEARSKEAVDALTALQRRAEVVDEPVGLGWAESPGGAGRLLAVLEASQHPPPVFVDWLSVDSLEPVRRVSAQLRSRCDDRQTVIDHLGAVVGPRVREVDAAWKDDIDGTVEGLRSNEPSWVPSSNVGAAHLRSNGVLLVWAAERLREVATEAAVVVAAFGLAEPAPSAARAHELGDLAGLVGSATPPEPHWLAPVAQSAIAEALRVLSDLLEQHRQFQQRLGGIFRPEALDMDLPALRARFAEVHRGVRKLSGAYRADKRRLASVTVAGRVDKATVAALDEAVAWKALDERLSHAESRHAEALGEHYYQRDRADFAEIRAAVEVAQRGLALAGATVDQQRLQQQLGRNGSPTPELTRVASPLTQTVEAVRSAADQHLGSEVTTRLLSLPLDAAVDWLERAAAGTDQLAGYVERIEELADRQMTLETTLGVLTEASKLALTESQMAEAADNAGALLGPMFAGFDSDWDAVVAGLDWSERVRTVAGGAVRRQPARTLLAAPPDPGPLRDALERWTKALSELLASFLPAYAEEVQADLEVSFESGLGLAVDLAASVGDVDEWMSFTEASRWLAGAGLEPVVEHCISLGVGANDVRPVVSRSVLTAWCDAVIAEDSVRLAPLRSGERDELVREFRQLDKEQIASAAERVINACAARRPASTAGTAGIIKRQAELKRRHMPIRELLAQAGPVAQRLKPCFMMSPLSVSQFLPPTLQFDAVIFDEASQVRPSDAVNCVYRGRQLIVAGDQKQLPPTSFFDRVSSQDDEDYDEEQLEEFGSVLDLAKAAGGLASLPLKWHYRSQHEDLIGFSNYKFYDGDMYTFPSVRDSGQDVGIQLFKVDGIYRRGGQRDNPIEAEAVADRVLFHQREHPHLTMGVVAFSTAQEDAIVAALERRMIESGTDGLLSSDRLDGFFVKSLESVQGDERDLIIFSIGYGPDENGEFTMNFGPLNKESGWKRLNVAITRARQRVEVVASVRAADFKSGLQSTGPRYLRDYLDFAERGRVALGLDGELGSEPADGPFEAELVRLLGRWGYDAVPRIGLGAYRVDIAVRDSSAPERWLLGIECDGSMYHSAPVARDRDRLRHEVLRGLGWRLHKAWAPAWFRDRRREEERLSSALDEAAAAAGVSLPVIHTDEGRIRVEVQTDVVDFGDLPEWVKPYEAADVVTRSPVPMDDPNARSEIARLIREIVRVEGPIRSSRVLQRVREAWGVGRAGSRIKANFDAALAQASNAEVDVDQAGFVWMKGSGDPVVRTPTDDPRSQRRVADVAIEELMEAVLSLTRDAHAISHDDLSANVARLFGWGRRGADIANALDEAIDALIDDKVLRRQEDGILACSE